MASFAQFNMIGLIAIFMLCFTLLQVTAQYCEGVKCTDFHECKKFCGLTAIPEFCARARCTDRSDSEVQQLGIIALGTDVINFLQYTMDAGLDEVEGEGDARSLEFEEWMTEIHESSEHLLPVLSLLGIYYQHLPNMRLFLIFMLCITLFQVAYGTIDFVTCMETLCTDKADCEAACGEYGTCNDLTGRCEGLMC
ncbi:hypothetical protein GE061_010099 [Apolygus lucorum]|uniref:Uncharacterized protein n=1 Tax=Apolygus lucorum TaxID=248454 RepID=A0A8S9Y2A5_APOLU|nr:hypothetical protein GE061_010099 [Apolygus lucorum]